MKQLSGHDLLGMHADANGPTPLLLDVREPWEFEHAAIRIDGLRTLHIPMNAIPGRLAEIDAAQPVVCICHHGMRSAQVVAFLERQGFDAVYNLAGGIAAWSEQVDPGVPRY
jgi:rhodanese-related sulfurtransferase